MILDAKPTVATDTALLVVDIFSILVEPHIGHLGASFCLYSYYERAQNDFEKFQKEELSKKKMQKEMEEYLISTIFYNWIKLRFYPTILLP